ncbi:UNKNOWN [Stylonychia lemnae]|uniref:Uncharacterized protein n=1 Tax=Stylonychia lemnae TaxID=5949 RepID=A0A078AT59_STYLE|nr:UNKNOWN [Stylonychia lemnae]|eukprot:CDW85206.1 UNKNOWN [Stylonychia lemnae]
MSEDEQVGQDNNSQDNFQEFIASRKIDLEALKREEGAGELQELTSRHLGILKKVQTYNYFHDFNHHKQRLESYPFNPLENFRQRADLISHFAEKVQEACFNAVAEDNDVPMLTIREGIKFRNCIQKFQVQFSTLKPNLRDAEFHFLNQKIIQFGEKNIPELKGISTDPYEAERFEALKILQERRQQEKITF